MDKTKNNMNNRIEELESLAEEVLSLKNLYRQRRPIVLEFCGSPKSGKTSSITSLNIFLKRNGFKTIVLTEKASVCPISNKHDPAFNIWTCTSTINEINEMLDRARSDEDIDIIISDRGIFDALCWFQWLLDNHKMKKTEYDIISKFITLHRWQKNIDLLYVFTSSPEESIRREYANLLTNKRGSIMNEEILNQYLHSVKKTMKKYQKCFRATHSIDTTKKEQSDVGYEVTSETLKLLKDMLIEKIGYTKNIPLVTGYNEFHNVESFLNTLKFNNRDVIEKDEALIQPIPIAVITNATKDKILCIKKTPKSTESNSPEAGKLLFYAGGHIRVEDKTKNKKENFLTIAKNTLERELVEELGISLSIEEDIPFVLYTPDEIVAKGIEEPNKSKQHLAIGWILSVNDGIKLNLDKYEIVQKKGTSKSGTFIAFSELEKMIISDKNIIESWSNTNKLKSRFFTE